MITRLKKLTKLKGKKRYLLLGFFAFELMSLPAAAQIVKHAAFQPRSLVTAIEIPTAEPGHSRFLVTSNDGFDVKAKHIAGDVLVKVHVSGSLNSVSRFGDAAQLPGPKTACVKIIHANASVYKADRKTAANPGTPPEQAVIFEFSYNPMARPDFEFTIGSKNIAPITQCSETNI